MADWLLIFLSVLVVALGAALLRLRVAYETLQAELRQVARTHAGQAERQGVELRWQRVLAAALPWPLLVTDAQKRLLYANPASESLFGHPTLGEGAIQRLRHHILEALLDEALQTGQAVPQVVARQGQDLLVWAHAWPPGAPPYEGAILLLQDVTELNRLARARREMAANLSHDLRTPLASVKLLLETLLGGLHEQPELAHHLLLRVATENEAMIRLVEDLTALSWLESGRTPLRLEPTNLRDLVELRLQRLAPQQELKQLRFEVEGPDAPVVELDPERFGQALSNLLDNAIKFSPEGGTIYITLRATAQGTYLAIRDEGPGILPHDLPRLFERFYKGDRVRTRSGVGGTGLGLAIARHLVEAHEGTLLAESTFGHGATFTIELPPD